MYLFTGKVERRYPDESQAEKYAFFSAFWQASSESGEIAIDFYGPGSHRQKRLQFRRYWSVNTFACKYASYQVIRRQNILCYLLHSLVRSDMCWAEAPRLRSISADTARAGGKDSDLGGTDRLYICWQTWIAAGNSTKDSWRDRYYRIVQTRSPQRDFRTLKVPAPMYHLFTGNSLYLCLCQELVQRTDPPIY